MEKLLFFQKETFTLMLVLFLNLLFGKTANLFKIRPRWKFGIWDMNFAIRVLNRIMPLKISFDRKNLYRLFLIIFLLPLIKNKKKNVWRKFPLTSSNDCLSRNTSFISIFNIKIKQLIKYLLITYVFKKNACKFN